MSATEVAAPQMPDRDIDPLINANRVIGKPLSRVDGPDKVSGRADYTGDITLDGLVYARLACSTIAKGRIAQIDASKAESAPGVLAVLTQKDAPKIGDPLLMTLTSIGAGGSSLIPMQDDRIHWNGQPVAIVIAKTQLEADHAASLVDVSYASEPAALDFEALLPQAVAPDNILGEPTSVSRGDAEAALAACDVQIDVRYSTPRHAHLAMETHSTMAHWNAEDRLTVWDACHSVIRTQNSFASAFGLDPEAVRVICRNVGGAFGNKVVWDHQLLCVAAAKIVGRPVRLALTREEVFRITGGRTLTSQRVALGAGRDGRLRSLIHTGTTAVVSHNLCPEQVSVPARHLYAADNYFIGQKEVWLDMVANAAMRAPGDSVGSFALESGIDELAVELDLDPIELRRRLEPAVDPTDGKRFSIRNLNEAYRRGAERFGWEQRSSTPAAHRDGPWRIGHGVASAFYPYLRMPGGAARIRVDGEGHATVLVAATDMGMGTATVQIQHAAERLGLPFERVSFEYGDSSLPTSPTAAASAQTASLVSAVFAASQALVEELLQQAGADSPLAGLEPDEVQLRDGGVFSVADPARGASYQAIVQASGQDTIEAEASPAVMPLEFLSYSMHSWGAQFCEVKVHDVTGEIRISRWVGSFDCGRILNPKTAASQLRGAIIMGIGSALMEEALFDKRSGRFMNPSAAEYHVPVHADVPDIDVLWTDIPDPHSPLGLHGVGEIGITGVAAAVANAIYNATGKRIRDLPITLDKVLATRSVVEAGPSTASPTAAGRRRPSPSGRHGDDRER